MLKFFYLKIIYYITNKNENIWIINKKLLAFISYKRILAFLLDEWLSIMNFKSV